MTDESLGSNHEWSTFQTSMEQFISVIKSLVEQVQIPDDLLNVDVMSILHVFARFLSRFTDLECNRVRVKFCALCDITLERLDKLDLRRDNLSRQNILMLVLDWILDPATVRPYFLLILLILIRLS